MQIIDNPKQIKALVGCTNAVISDAWCDASGKFKNKGQIKKIYALNLEEGASIPSRIISVVFFRGTTVPVEEVQFINNAAFQNAESMRFADNAVELLQRLESECGKTWINSSVASYIYEQIAKGTVVPVPDDGNVYIHSTVPGYHVTINLGFPTANAVASWSLPYDCFIPVGKRRPFELTVDWIKAKFERWFTNMQKYAGLEIVHINSGTAHFVTKETIGPITGYTVRMIVAKKELVNVTTVASISLLTDAIALADGVKKYDSSVPAGVKKYVLPTWDDAIYDEEEEEDDD